MVSQIRLRQAQTDINLILIFLLVILMSCNSKKQIDIQGHRGCRGLLPENSLPAFEKAIDCLDYQEGIHEYLYLNLLEAFQFLINS